MFIDIEKCTWSFKKIRLPTVCSHSMLICMCPYVFVCAYMYVCMYVHKYVSLFWSKTKNVHQNINVDHLKVKKLKFIFWKWMCIAIIIPLNQGKRLCFWEWKKFCFWETSWRKKKHKTRIWYKNHQLEINGEWKDWFWWESIFRGGEYLYKVSSYLHSL